MAKKISDLTTITSIQTGDYIEVARTASVASNISVKRDLFDEFGDNFARAPGLLFNVAVKATVASSALTIFMTQSDGATNPGTDSARCRVGFRSPTLSDGSFTVLDVTATTSTVISAGSTGGFASGQSDYLYVYAINNAGTVELAWSATGYRDEGLLWTTTAEGGAGAADARSTLYSTTARSNVPIRLIGKLTLSEAVSGNWTTAPTAIRTMPHFQQPSWEPYPGGAYVFPSGTQTVAAGILAVGAVTTAPAFGTGTILKAWYRDWGDSIDIDIRIHQTATTSATAGSGLYLIPLPLGKTFNSTIITPTTGSIYQSTRVGNLAAIANGADTYMFTAQLSPQTSTYFALHGPYSNSPGFAQLATFQSGGVGSPNLYTTVNIGGIITGIPVTQ